MKTLIEDACLHLFVPADRQDRIPKAAKAGADAVIIDLEDAVAPSSKAAAREGLLRLDIHDMALVLRINAVGEPWHDDDLNLASRMPLKAIMLPKCEHRGDVESVQERTGLPVIALVESAVGIANVAEIAAAATRLAFGSVDYAADLCMGHTTHSLLHARSQLVQASRIAGIASPIDGVTTSISDEEKVAVDCVHAVEMGFGGKLLIHPAQVAAARRAFAPTEQEVEWATRVHSIAVSGHAAVKLDGAMVDAPVILRARQILQRAGVEGGR